jgi:hypothetical protein
MTRIDAAPARARRLSRQGRGYGGPAVFNQLLTNQIYCVKSSKAGLADPFGQRQPVNT